MFAKKLFQKATQYHHHHHQTNGSGLTASDLNIRATVHYGIPSTASILAVDCIQRLLAIGTLDGRIKVIGGDNIEGLLISQKQLPYKYLEFLQNQGFLVSITNENDIQVWNLKSRSVACDLHWESNITAFSVINGSSFMYVGDEYGTISVLKFHVENRELLQLPYQILWSSLSEAAGLPYSDHQPVVGIHPQPFTSGNSRTRYMFCYSMLIFGIQVGESYMNEARKTKKGPLLADFSSKIRDSVMRWHSMVLSG